MGDKPYVLRALQPSEDRVTLNASAQSRRMLEPTLLTMAKLLAWAQLRSSGQKARHLPTSSSTSVDAEVARQADRRILGLRCAGAARRRGLQRRLRRRRIRRGDRSKGRACLTKGIRRRAADFVGRPGRWPRVAGLPLPAGAAYPKSVTHRTP